MNLSRSLKVNDGKVPEATNTSLFAALPIAVINREGMS